MVEMSETANILNNATPRSLVILDEIGRGTSTYDGLSIAWAVTEDLVKKKKKGVKTLFATHYHELLQLAHEHKRIQNFSIAVREWRGNIIFLHKLIQGGTNKSYGIQVAGLAGVPPHVVSRAQEVLKNIEQGHQLKNNSIPGSKKSGRKRKHPDQLSLFDKPDLLREFLTSFDINECTPLDALNTLHDLKKLL
jgi:DNA mismatch repair protein MutS